MPVHLGGYPCHMEAIMKISKGNDIWLLEDAAHRLKPSTKGGLRTIGDFGSFQFHEVKKPLHSCGEGDIVVTNSDYGNDFPKARFGGF